MRIILQLLLFSLLFYFCKSASLILNNDFENTACPNILCDVFTSGPSNYLPDWTVLQNGVDITRTDYLHAYSGSWSVDLNADDTGGITQSFPTTIGAMYEISFAMAGYPPEPPSVVSMNVVVTGQSAQMFQFTTVGKSASNIKWDLHSFTFVANAAMTTLSFISLDSGNSGAYIDLVNVILVNPTTGTTANPTTGTTGRTCFDDGTYHTQSEGDWGDKCAEGFNTGCYRDENFATCFPNGLDVGCICLEKTSLCGYHIHLDTSADVENFLPQLGSPDVLDQNYVNPSNPPPMSTSSGNFGGQVTALALSLGFSDCDPLFHSDCGNLGDLYVCDNRCANCKRNGNCRKNNNGCKFLKDEELDIEEEDLELRTNKNQNFNNNNNGKPKYANCEAFFGFRVQDIFEAASKTLGGCASCLNKKDTAIDERNENCVRNSKCKKNPERNNNTCNRNSNCKKNKNCCCCPDQSDPFCNPVLLNNCVTFINQAFIFGKILNDVQSGNVFQETPCGGSVDD